MATRSNPTPAARSLRENRALEEALAVLVAYELAQMAADVQQIVRTRSLERADEALARRERAARQSPNPVLVTALAAGILAALLLGRHHAVRAVGLPRVAAPGTAGWVGDVRADLPRSWATAATVERAAADLADWGIVRRSVYDTLKRRARAQAFTIAGVEELSVIDLARRTLRKAIEAGLSSADAAAELGRQFAGAGFTPLRPWHGRLVAHMTYAKAYGQAQRAVLMAPKLAGLIPALKWVTRADERVRYGKYNRAHLYVHGKVFARDHAFWRRWWVPAGFFCRCIAMGVNAADWAKRGKKSDEWPLFDGRRVQPDPGFAHAAARRLARAA